MGANSSFAQEDDSLELKIFDYNDLNSGLDTKKKTVTSANRLAENPEDLAQQIIIIDGDDIRKFGYSTLVDVLKSIPGFRTSQPGNAIEGETFLMRGLYGNDHTKILINGIPIKPEAVKGMPIAAQLPIRHAERIEIVLGPSSSVYGSDAIAGVINIVLPEIDRPVFAWADVNLLTPQTTEFNLTLGGKVGKGENILNYEIFASSQRASDMNLLIPDDSIRVLPNQLDANEQQLFFGDEGIPEIDVLKKESRLMGAYFKFRWFEISAMNMFREEHSGIGSHPLVSSYHNAGTTFGENINSFSLKYHDVKVKRFQSMAAISALTYKTLQNSAYYGVTHAISNGQNHMYGRSLDLHGEYQGIFKMKKNMNFLIGVTGDYAISHPFTNFLLRPFRSDEISFVLRPQDEVLETAVLQSAVVYALSKLDSTVFLERFTKYNVAGFLHYSYRAKSGKLNLELGTRIDINSFNQTVFTPKFGVVYKPVKNLRIRAYYGKGHRAPRSYFLYNNYTQAASVFDPGNGTGLVRQRTNHLSENLHGGEIGTNWQVNKSWDLSLGYYAHLMENKLMKQIYDVNSINAGPADSIGFGFFNGDSYSFLNSIMLVSNYKKTLGKLSLDILLSYEYASGWEIVEAEDNAPATNVTSSGYRFVPEHSIKANLTLSMFDFTLSLRNNVIGNYVTDVFRVNKSVRYDETDKFFYNLDILLHKQLFRQLSIFGGVYNVLNSVQSGIPNVSLSNTWGFNPQFGRTYKFGLTFKLN